MDIFVTHCTFKDGQQLSDSINYLYNKTQTFCMFVRFFRPVGSLYFSIFTNKVFLSFDSLMEETANIPGNSSNALEFHSMFSKITLIKY